MVGIGDVAAIDLEVRMLGSLDIIPQNLREARRVLKPGGRFHLMDFAKADSVSASRIARWIHSSPRLNDNSEARLVSLMREAGLSDPKRIGKRSSHAGELAYYQATSSP